MDRFFSAFIVAFLFIYVGIVLQSRDSEQQTKLNREARNRQEALIASIARQMEYKRTKDAFARGTSGLDPINTTVVVPEISLPTAVGVSSAGHGNQGVSRVSDAKTRKRLTDEIRQEYDRVKEDVELEDKLAKASAELARLGAESAKETTHSIPGIPISVPDSLILSLFPLGVFGGLLRVWFYRRAYLHHVEESEGVPLWAGPIRFSQFALSSWHWLLINFAILVIVGLATTLTFDYLWSALGSDEPLKRSLARVYVVVGVFTLIVYLGSLIDVIVVGEKRLVVEKSTHASIDDPD